MSKIMIVFYPARLRQLPKKHILPSFILILISLVLLVQPAIYRPVLLSDTRQLTGQITNVTFSGGYSRYSSVTASFQIGAESCQTALHTQKLGKLLRSDQLTESARVLVTGAHNRVVELEYDDNLYHSLEQENTRIQRERRFAFLLGMLILVLDLILIAVLLLSYRIVLLRSRPKNIQHMICIKK